MYFDYLHGDSFEVFVGRESSKKQLCEIFMQGYANWKESMTTRTLDTKKR